MSESNPSLENALEQLHLAVTTELLNKILSGEASPSDLNVARQLLRDNDYTVQARRGTPLFQLSEALPFVDPDQKVASNA